MRKRRVLFVLAGALLGAGTWGALVAAPQPRVDASALALLEANEQAVQNLRSVSCDMETRWDNERRLTTLRVSRPGYAHLSRRLERRTAPGAPWKLRPSGDAAHFQNGKARWTVLGAIGTAPAPIRYANWDIEPGLSGVCDNGLLCAMFKPERAFPQWIKQARSDETSRLVWLRDAGRATVEGASCRVLRLRVQYQVRKPGLFSVVTASHSGLVMGYSLRNWSDMTPLWKTYDATLYIAESDHLARRETMVVELGGATGTREAMVRNLRINPNLPAADFPAVPASMRLTPP